MKQAVPPPQRSCVPVSEAVECRAHHLVSKISWCWTWDSSASTEGGSPGLFNSAAGLCPAEETVCLCCLSSVLVLVGFLFEVIQSVGNCLYWDAFSAGLAWVADLTLSSVGCVAELAGKAVWCCMVLEMGKSGRAPVSGWLRLSCAIETGLKRQRGEGRRQLLALSCWQN